MMASFGSLPRDQKTIRREIETSVVRIRALAKAKAIDGLVAELSNPLEDEYLTIRAVAMRHLGKLRAREAVAPLAALLLEDPNEGVRAIAAHTLGRIRDEAAVGPLITALSDRSVNVQIQSSRSLGKLGDDRAEPHLQALLQSRDPKVRKAAAKAQRQLRPSQELDSP
jgi:HEAT repeat protein